MWARSRALPSSKMVRRVMTSSRKRTKAVMISLMVIMPGRPLSIASMLTPKEVCSAV